MTGSDIRDLVSTLNNVSPASMVRHVYDRPDDHYTREKATILREDPLRWLSSLSGGSLERLAELVTARASGRQVVRP